VGDFAEQAFAGEVFGGAGRIADDFGLHAQVARVAAALVADLAEFSGFLLGFDHLAGGLDGIGHHFFAVDVFTGLEGHGGVRLVEVVRGGDEDGVERRLFGEQFAEVGVAVDLGAFEQFLKLLAR
jgi:hypothetical protein